MQIHKHLSVSALNMEQALRTCGPYHFLVQENGLSGHTAFCTRAALERWADERGLDLVVPEALEMDEFGQGKTNTYFIERCYGTEMHMSMDEFYALPNIVVRSKALSNGDWVEAFITEQDDGMRVVHTLNPNVTDRRTFDWRETSRQMR